MNHRSAAAAAVLAALATGCPKDPPPPPPQPKVEAPKPPPEPVKPPEPTKPPEPPKPASDRECVGAIADGAPASILTIGGKKAELAGYKLTFLDKDKDDEAHLGVLADIDEDTSANLFNLKRYVDWFKAEKADGIVVDGDVGGSEAGITRALNVLAESGLPVFVQIGNYECKADFKNALAAVQKAHPNVVDLTMVRYVDFDDVTLVSLPGYPDAQYTHCPTSPCLYTAGDIDELKPTLAKATSPVVLVTHGPPQGKTPGALDAITGGKNIGDARLNALITDGKIPFGIFANIKEAGGHATDLTGENQIKEGVLSDALYLDPGAADGEAWTMNDGTSAVGMAAMLNVKGKQASFKVFHAKKLSAADTAAAAKAFPAPAPAPVPAPK